MIPDPGTTRVTLKDVAREAGVAASTVSKVINDRPDVGPKVRQQVLETIERMGFRPNTVARGLRMRRSDTIAIVADDLEGTFTSTMMRGVEDAAFAADVGVLLCNSYGDVERERKQLRRLLDKQVDALIFMSGARVGARPSPALPIPPSVPFLYLYEYGEPGIASVLPDDFGGAVTAVRHLAERGAREIAFINGPAGWEATVDRLRGYRAGLEEAGMLFDDRLVLDAASWSPADGFGRMTALIESGRRFDAVFCASDDLALGVLNALGDAGRRVPEDVQLVGYDDRAFSRHQRPPLTTIALPLLEMGELAGRLILDAISTGKTPTDEIRMPCRLIERESTRRK